ncbi:HAMP domain-containing histidine kinase [Roseomonas gilardii subsp. gilardii]|uniref:sensor histidine kinase n=1 Tax=Roseomonas gilardii TaxID=257708 RepID=UPI001FFAB3EF|nr:HAMP domain-containing sensor histidine kinase [Roseomonas gilardii]UPG72871.1 HAMP domain-containing histidine kinase [Roseomonas gilardii subsp. gilardii]
MNGTFPPQNAGAGTGPGTGADGQLERELAYYRRECNALGARLLRLQEEQSQAFREARRSRTVAKLIREAYRLADHGSAPEDLGEPMLEIVVDNTICDRAALLQETPRGSQRFRVTHSLGLPQGLPPAGAPPLGEIFIPAPPPFFFTTSRTRLEPPAYELTGILRLPYVLWAYDAATGMALILGNQSESNVSRPFEEADQELIEGALSVYIDVLLRKRSEAELRLAKAQAEEASSTRSRFLATLTHELRTPLNAIIGFSEMMATGSGYEPTAHERGEYNRHILNSAKHLLALINEILDYSSLARGRTTLGRRWLPLNDLLKEVVGATAGTAAEREVEVACDLPEEVWWIRVDRTRFRQILDNLLSNAMRFTAPGGRVMLEASCHAGEGLRLRVRDNGVGIAPEDIPRALEPFRQVGDPLSRSSTGTGLGLPIAKGLAEAHGGSLQIESQPGVGTTITVQLPAECVAAGGPPQG